MSVQNTDQAGQAGQPDTVKNRFLSDERQGQELITSNPDQVIIKEKSTTTNPIIAENYTLWYAIIATINACLGFFYIGYNVTIFNSLIGPMQNYLYPDRDRATVVFAAAAPFTTAAIFSFLGGGVASNLGRRKAMILADIVGIIGVILCLFHTFGLLIAGRLLVGVSFGLSSVAASLYFTEMAPVRLRGEFTNILNILSATGILIATLLNQIVPPKLDSGQKDGTWRIVISFGMIPAIVRIICLLTYFKLDTPGYYINSKQRDKAAAILKKVAKEGADKRIEALVHERDYIQYKGKVHFYRIFGERFRLAVFVCIIMMSLNYLTGLNIILIHTGDIYSQGISSTSHISNILGVTTAFINLVTAFLSVYTTFRFGRKPMIIFGTAFSAIIFIIYGILAQAVSENSLLPKIFLVFWPIGWGLSVGSVMFVYVSESLPDIGVAVATVFTWVFAFVTTQVYLPAVDTMGRGWVHIMFGLISLVGTCLLFFLMKESKGYEKADILKLYGGHEPPPKYEAGDEHKEHQKQVKAEKEKNYIEGYYRSDGYAQPESHPDV